MIVFSTYALGRFPNLQETIGLLALVILLSLLLFYGVEQRLRYPATRYFKSPLAFNMACASAAMIALAPAAHSWAQAGWPWRVPDALRNLNEIDRKAMKAYIWPRQIQYAKKDAFRTNKQRVLIIGDLQSADLINVLAEGGLTDQVEIVARTVFNECGIPYLDDGELANFLRTKNQSSKKDPKWLTLCPTLISRVVDTPAWKQADMIIISFLWREKYLEEIPISVKQLRGKTEAPIYVIGNKMFDGSSIELANRFGHLDGLESYAAASVNSDTQTANHLLSTLLEIHFVDILLDPLQAGVVPRPDERLYAHPFRQDAFHQMGSKIRLGRWRGKALFVS